MAEELLLDVLRKFCADAIEGVPLPKPWSLQQDALGRVFFLNNSTGASQWDHPLGTSLAKVCALCRAYVLVPLDQRADMLAIVQQHWESEARREYSKWYAVEHASGETYYCHEESDEATWDHPNAIVLPQYYMRLRAVSRLGEDAYIDKLCIANMDVCIQCITDKAVQPAEKRDVPHHLATARHFHSTQMPHVEHRVDASGCKLAAARARHKSCAPTYFIGDIPGMVAMQEQLQYFDLAVGDDALETEGRKAVLARSTNGMKYIDRALLHQLV